MAAPRTRKKMLGECKPWTVIRLDDEFGKPLAVVTDPEVDGVARKPGNVRCRAWDGSVVDYLGSHEVTILKVPGQLSLEYIQKLKGYHP